MFKNLLSTLIILMVASVAFDSIAALPPKYLEIKDFKLCLATQKISTYSAWCMPSERLENCPTTSWEQLKALTGTKQVPACLLNSTVATPSPGDNPAAK